MKSKEQQWREAIEKMNIQGIILNDWVMGSPEGGGGTI